MALIGKRCPQYPKEHTLIRNEYLQVTAIRK
jgi:hypothetical protein